MSNTKPRTVPGRFRPNVFKLVGEGGTQDLQNFAGQLTIFENVLTQGIFGELAIGDAKNLVRRLKLRGTEKVIVEFQSEQGVTPLKYTFVVTGITNRVLKEDRESMYTLRLSSEEAYRDSSMVATKRFDGKPKAVLQQIYDEFIAVDKGLDFFGLEFKREEFVFVANYWSGFKCMNYVCRQAAPKGSPEYMPNTLFFQSDKKNYCTSLSKMAHIYKSNRLVYDCFNYVSDQMERSGGDSREPSYNYIHPWIHEKYVVMDGVSHPTFADIYHDLNTGYMGSLTVGFDMGKRMPYLMMFDYTPNQAGVPNGNLPKVKGNQALLDFTYDSFYHLYDKQRVNPIHSGIMFHPFSNVNVAMGNHNLWDDKEFGYDKFHFENIAFRDSAIAELTRHQIDINVNGRTDVDLGMLVYLQFPNPEEKGENPPESLKLDKKLSGLYQIMGIRHDFMFGDAFEHKMKLEVIRDSHEQK